MHLGVIPDGNRRYARENNVEKKEAYRRAKDVILDIFEDMSELPADIQEVTFYLLSEDNLERSDDDLNTLFELLQEQIQETASQFNGNGFSFNWVSTQPRAIPRGLRKKLEKLEKKHSDGDKQLNALISYSGRTDIVKAAEEISENGDSFSRDALKSHLEIETDIDFVIRTGNNPTRECLSGFPIWNSSYSEYYHIQKHFPEVTMEDITTALEHYKELRRKKGE